MEHITVQPKAITFPTDAKRITKAREIADGPFQGLGRDPTPELERFEWHVNRGIPRTGVL
jgi:hypothetical protein